MLGNKGSRKFYRVGGTRGGQDQFSWDSVKTDKDRENYLGHSLQAPIGRWQKGKDLLWYAKDGKSLTERQDITDEREALRNMDEDLMNEALGIKKKTNKFLDSKLDPTEIKQLFARGGAERASTDIERIEGLGAAPAKFHEHIERLSYVEKEILKLKEGKESSNTATFPNQSLSVIGDNNHNLDVEESKDKKKKKDKKHKKEHKHKKKKEEKSKDKKRKRSSSRSSSDR